MRRLTLFGKVRWLIVGDIPGPPRWGAPGRLFRWQLLVIGSIDAQASGFQLLDPGRDHGPDRLHGQFVESPAEELDHLGEVANVEGVGLFRPNANVVFVIGLVNKLVLAELQWRAVLWGRYEST